MVGKRPQLGTSNLGHHQVLGSRQVSPQPGCPTVAATASVGPPTSRTPPPSPCTCSCPFSHLHSAHRITPLSQHICTKPQFASSSPRLSTVDPPPHHQNGNPSSLQLHLPRSPIPTLASSRSTRRRSHSTSSLSCPHLAPSTSLHFRHHSSPPFRPPYPNHSPMQPNQRPSPHCIQPQNRPPRPPRPPPASPSTTLPIHRLVHPPQPTSFEWSSDLSIPRMLLSSTCHTPGSTLCSPSDTTHPQLLHPHRRQPSPDRVPSRPNSPIPHEPQVSEHHPSILPQAHPSHLHSVKPPPPDSPLIVSLPPPGTTGSPAEDYCLTPHLFRQFLTAIRTQHLPSPTIDTWASPDQHVLPTFTQDFFNTPFTPSQVLWINPRFSCMHHVLNFLQRQQLRAYVLSPHWPPDTHRHNTWWQPMWQHLQWHIFFSQGQPAFTARHQSSPRPCPWAFYIGWLDFTEKSLTSVQRQYYQLLASANYPPLPPSATAYGQPQLPKCYKHLIEHATPSSPVFLAPVATTRIDYTAVLGLAAELKFPELDTLHHMYSCLNSRAAFNALFTANRPPPGAGFPSRLPASVIQDAIKYGIINTKVRPCFYMKCFLVPKADPSEGGRLIQDDTPVNQQITLPWKCNLMHTATMIRFILSFSWAAILDAKSWYFQFALSEEVQPVFGIRQPSVRGALAVLPQGFSPSGAIAQTTSLVLDYGLPATCHMDNHAICGHTVAEVKQHLTVFLNRCNRCNVKLKDEHPSIRQQFIHLGIEFDQHNSKYAFLKNGQFQQQIFSIFSARLFGTTTPSPSVLHGGALAVSFGLPMCAVFFFMRIGDLCLSAVLLHANSNAAD